MNTSDLIAQLQTNVPWVLLVDDDYHITQGLKDILEDVGYHVEMAQTGEQAELLLAERSFCAMVLDYSLPDTNGIELARRVSMTFPSLDMILMTGHDRFEIKELELNELFIAFLRKPVEITGIIDAIDQAVQKQRDLLHVPKPPPIKIQPVQAPVVSPVVLDDVMASSAPSSRRLAACTLAAFIAGASSGWMIRSLGNKPSVPTLAPRATEMECIAPISVLETPIQTPPTMISPDKISPKPTEPATTPSSHKTILLMPAPTPAPAPAVTVPSREDLQTRLKSTDPAIQLTAAKTLLKMSPDHPEAIAFLISLMQANTAAQRLAAIEIVSLAHVDAPDIITSLAGHLTDDDLAVAYASAKALAHLGTAAVPAIPQLAEALAYQSESSESVSHEAEEALVQIGKAGVPSLIKELENLTVRQQVISVLARLGPEAQEALPALLALKEDSMIGATALDAIARIQTPTAQATPETALVSTAVSPSPKP